MNNLTWRREKLIEANPPLNHEPLIQTRHLLVDENNKIYASVHSSSSAGAAVYQVYEKPISLNYFSLRKSPKIKHSGHFKTVDDSKKAVDKLINKKETKIIKCPKCGKEIDYLYYFEEKETSAVFYAEDGNELYDEDNIDITKSEFSCPECGYLIANTQSNAAEFLQGTWLP